jgi:hypothetical protein
MAGENGTTPLRMCEIQPLRRLRPASRWDNLVVRSYRVLFRCEFGVPLCGSALIPPSKIGLVSLANSSQALRERCLSYSGARDFQPRHPFLDSTRTPLLDLPGPTAVNQGNSEEFRHNANRGKGSTSNTV